MIGVIYLNWYSNESSAIIAAQLAAAQLAGQNKGIDPSVTVSVMDANTPPGTDPRTLPGFQQMMQMLQFGTVDTVLVGTLNRLAQDGTYFPIAMTQLRGIFQANIISAGGWDTFGGDLRDAISAMGAGA